MSRGVHTGGVGKFTQVASARFRHSLGVHAGSVADMLDMHA